MQLESKTIPFNTNNKTLADAISSLFSGELAYKHLPAIHVEIQKISDTELQDYVTFVVKTAKEQGYTISRSSANKGLFGFANKIGRLIKFTRNLFRKKGRRILAEGDSWFEYIFSRDTISHLQGILKCRIKTIASGGDWLGAYFLSNDLEQTLTRFRPEVLLLSGGGNDLLQEGNIKNLIDVKQTELRNQSFSKDEAEKFAVGLLNQRFYTSIAILGFFYVCIIERINRTVPRPIQVIAHGYDYPFPSTTRKSIPQKLLKNGQWLAQPLSEIGIVDKNLQRAISLAMINEFNSMLSHLAHAPSLYNFLFVDARGFAPEPINWQDELHPKSEIFLALAQAFKSTMETPTLKTGVHKLRM